MFWNNKEVGVDVKTFFNTQALREAQKRGVELFCVDPEEKPDSVKKRMLGLITRNYFFGLEASTIRRIIRSLETPKKMRKLWKLKNLIKPLRKAV